MRSFGPRVDPDTGALHARVAQAHDYDRVTILRRERVGNGTLETELVRSAAPGTRRLVQLHARYAEGDTAVDRIVKCEHELDEARCRRRLHADMLEAARKPSS